MHPVLFFTCQSPFLLNTIFLIGRAINGQPAGSGGSTSAHLLLSARIHDPQQKLFAKLSFRCVISMSVQRLLIFKRQASRIFSNLKYSFLNTRSWHTGISRPNLLYTISSIGRAVNGPPAGSGENTSAQLLLSACIHNPQQKLFAELSFHGAISMSV